MKWMDKNTCWWKFESQTHVAMARKAALIAFAFGLLMIAGGAFEIYRGDHDGIAGVVFGIAFFLLAIGTRAAASAFQRIIELESKRDDGVES